MSTPETPLTRPPLAEPEPKPASKGKEIADLCMLSGLSWDELAQVFGVSRKRMYAWASDEPLDAANAEFVMQVLEVARHADRGTAVGTRAALRDASKGRSPFDLLIDRRFEEARKALGPSKQIPRPKLGKLNYEINDAWRPLPLKVLLDARQERVHKYPDPFED